MMRIRKTKKVVSPSLLLPYFASPPRRILLSQRPAGRAGRRALPAVGRRKEIVVRSVRLPEALASSLLCSLPRRIAGRLIFSFLSRKDAKPQRNLTALLSLVSCLLLLRRLAT
jgi:hypothetical protein